MASTTEDGNSAAAKAREQAFSESRAARGGRPRAAALANGAAGLSWLAVVGQLVGENDLGGAEAVCPLWFFYVGVSFGAVAIWCDQMYWHNRTEQLFHDAKGNRKEMRRYRKWKIRGTCGRQGLELASFVAFLLGGALSITTLKQAIAAAS